MASLGLCREGTVSMGHGAWDDTWLTCNSNSSISFSPLTSGIANVEALVWSHFGWLWGGKVHTGRMWSTFVVHLNPQVDRGLYYRWAATNHWARASLEKRSDSLQAGSLLRSWHHAPEEDLRYGWIEVSSEKFFVYSSAAPPFIRTWHAWIWRDHLFFPNVDTLCMPLDGAWTPPCWPVSLYTCLSVPFDVGSFIPALSCL